MAKETLAELKEEMEGLVGKEELARRFRKWILDERKKELAKASNLRLGEFFLKEAQTIIEDLNMRTKSRYTLTSKTKSMIKARMDEGHTVADFLCVHTYMAKQWLGDEWGDKFLRPATLYQAGKFEGYLNEGLRAEELKREKLNAKGSAGSASCSTAQGRTQNVQKDTEKAENAKLTAELMERKWWQFEDFSEFVQWTAKLPTAEAIAAYNMPDRLRSNRTFKGVLIAAATGKGMNPRFEEEYQSIKNYELRIMNEDK